MMQQKIRVNKNLTLEPTHLGTKRPSEGADILALRGVLCLALSPLSLKKENG